MNFCGGNSFTPGGNTKQKFDDPFLLPSGDYMPETMSEALDFCRFLYMMNPEYRRASQRVTRHFITRLVIEGAGSKAEADQVEDYLKYNLKLFTALQEMGDDWACFGNAFYRVHFPFKRLLIRREKGKKPDYYNLSCFQQDQMRFNIANMTYSAPDPQTGKTVEFEFADIKLQSKENIALVKYDPRTIEILHSDYTGRKQFLYKIPAKTVNAVQSGDIFQINNLTRKMLQAIHLKKNFLFSEDEMFHFKAPSISGVSDSDWGLPEPIANFRLLYQIQVYRKIDEVVGLDYMMPFRVLSMDAKGGDGAAAKFDAVRWKKEMNNIVKTWRKDRSSMFAVPMPVNYQEVGGSGKSLAPKELIEYQVNNMLNAMGYPAELYNMSLTTQQLPNALRLFEQAFWFVHEGYNNFCRWVVGKINNYLNNQRLDISLEPPKMADNVDQQNILLQLVAQGEIPREEAFKHLGITDPLESFRKRTQEEIERAKIQQKAEKSLQQEMEAEASLAAAAAGPEAAGQEEGGTTPMDVEQRAMAKAQEWLQIPSDGERRKAMDATRAQNFTLYAMAKEIMEQQRSEGASQGRQAVNEQGGMA